MRATVLPLDPATYVPHALHQGERRWLETNCYVDVWIELLHALGHEPLACMGFTVRTDLEADQWTFFKPSHADIDLLFGIEIGELNIWSSLVAQTAAEVAAGHPVLVELDAWYLPDTRGTTYGTAHSKTTVAVMDIDPDQRRLGYFHSAGYFTLEGDDFDSVFRLDPTRFDASDLPPYAEFVKPHAAPPLRGDALRSTAADLLRIHAGRAPANNPFVHYRERFLADLAQLPDESADHFHAYAFANMRQIGASFELAAAHLRWLGDGGLEPAAEHFTSLSASAKSLQMKAARRALAKRTVDVSAELDALESSWDLAFDRLRSALG